MLKVQLKQEKRETKSPTFSAAVALFFEAENAAFTSFVSTLIGIMYVAS